MPTTNGMSMTQAGNMITIVAFLGLILSHYGINISQADLTTIVTGVVVLVGVVTSYIGRYRHGDVTLMGIKTTVDDSRGI